VSAPVRAARRHADFDVVRDYQRLRGPLLGLLRRDGWTITDDEWDAAWNAVCTNVWKAQKRRDIDFRGEPLNYLLASAKNELRRERRRLRLETVSLDAADAPEPPAPGPELDDELDLRDKLRIAQTIARNRLRPHELRAWGLRVVCGLTYEEGAARLGIAPKRFEKQLLAAHAKIADEIRAVAAGTWCDSTKGVSLLRAYEEGVLDPEGSALRELREHARTCSACRRAMKAVEGIVPLMLPPAPVLLAVSTGGAEGTGPGAGGRLVEHVDEIVAWVQAGEPHPIQHTPSVIERALDFARIAASQQSIRVSETAPATSNAAELVGSAGAGGAALGVGLAVKVLVAGSVALCAVGGQQLCAELVSPSPAPLRSTPQTVALRPKFPHSAAKAPIAPSVKAAQVQPRAGATAAQHIATGVQMAAIHRAERRASSRSSSPSSQASSPSTTSATASSSAPSDPTFSPTAQTTSPSSGSGTGTAGGGGNNGGSSSSSTASSDSTFQALP